MRRVLAALLVLGAIVYLANASWLTDGPVDPTIHMIAHRGVHQTFSDDELRADTCTASRIYQPVHEFLENTIPSMRVAFASGAEIVELDLHPTADGQFAVFHDWTLECRTDATGRTSDLTMAELKTLDAGYGYTANHGRTFPFRGKGVGLIPSLVEVFTEFPNGKFLLNFKSNDASEGDLLADLLEAHPAWRKNVWGAYGGDGPSYEVKSRIADLSVWTRKGLVDCLLQYEVLGWTGYMPDTCAHTKVMVPINVAQLLWGWPNRFLNRMHSVGSEVILLGPYQAGDAGTSGVDSIEQFEQVPTGFDGYVWTNHIEQLGPYLAARP